MIRGALTGHPAIGGILGGQQRAMPASELEVLQRQHAQVWELVHASRYSELAPILAALIPGLENASRTARTEQLQRRARELLTDTYQATAAAMAKLGETDAAWIAADRAAFTAEAIGAPLTVAASMFRMAHVFLSLGQLDQAQQVATATSHALEPVISASNPPVEALSLYGALHLVLAIAAARDNDRTQAHQHLDTARTIAERTGQDRDDYGTEFGPSNVAIHAVAVAVELGDAGTRPGPGPRRSDGRAVGRAQVSLPHRPGQPRTPCAARSAKPCTTSRKPRRSPPSRPARTGSPAMSPATCSSSPACGHGQNCATSPSDSASCPSRSTSACDPTTDRRRMSAS